MIASSKYVTRMCDGMYYKACEITGRRPRRSVSSEIVVIPVDPVDRFRDSSHNTVKLLRKAIRPIMRRPDPA